MFGGIARVWSGTPVAKAIGQLSWLAVNQTRSLYVHLTQGTDHTTSSTETWEKPATSIGEGSTQISNAAATAVSGTSIPCIEVTIQNQVGNGVMGVGGSGITGPTGDGVSLAAGASITLKIDDVSKVYCYATNNNDRVDWTYLAR